jgi:hypothetical protein
MRQASFQFSTWIEVKDGNPTARDIFNGHYSRRRYADGRNPKLFVGPGEKMVLVTPKADALFVWRKFISLDNQEGVNCAVFRNESAQLSSFLILEAEKLAWQRWPGQRLYTYVNPRKVASRNPGYCFQRAGWRRCGTTKSKLLVFEKLPLCDSEDGAGRAEYKIRRSPVSTLGASLFAPQPCAAEGGGSFAAPSGARSLV